MFVFSTPIQELGLLRVLRNVAKIEFSLSSDGYLSFTHRCSFIS